MEASSLLKCRGGGASPAVAAAANVRTTAATAIGILRPPAETDEDDGERNDDGPFFDLQFSVPEEDGEVEEEDEVSSDESDEEAEDREYNFTVSSEGSFGRGSLRSDPSISLSPADDLFYKGRVLPIDPSSLVFTSSESPNSKLHFTSSLLKSATKFRVFMLRFKRSKSTPSKSYGATTATASPKQRQQSKLFVKFKEEEVPIVSLFTRDTSSRCSGSSRSAKLHAEDAVPSLVSAASDEKKFAKDVIQKYLNKIKPYYVRVSKRYGEKLRFSGQLTSGRAVVDGEKEPSASWGHFKSQKSQAGNLPAGLRIVCKRLRKSRSASSAVAAVRSPPPPLPRRRDDSLLQHEDGIQSAIAHCKRSYNADKGSELPLVRSRSDPGGERSDVGMCIRV